MTLIDTESDNKPEDEDLLQASLRELIAQLALVEDEHRSTTDPHQLAALAHREQAIVRALRHNGRTYTYPSTPNMLRPEIIPGLEEHRMASR
ncbi:hypothetical protein AAFM46_16450 (plasmid) [Arthrobacter sp. TMP15]|uniref:hypothetical protein n=1 Tax=Arthrobacter sp. TMP15 TaxID=3140789 RepID=UPI0031BA725F